MITIKDLTALGFLYNTVAGHPSIKLFHRNNVYNEPLIYRINGGCKGVSYSLHEKFKVDNFKTISDIKTYWLNKLNITL